jgi:hypothetical protein
MKDKQAFGDVDEFSLGHVFKIIQDELKHPSGEIK